MVKGKMRVYNKNPAILEYWVRREYINAYNQILSLKVRRLYNLQNGRCPYCDRQIVSLDVSTNELHVHHMKPRSLGGSESHSNLKLLHSECHRELHVKFSREEMKSLTDMRVDYVKHNSKRILISETTKQ